MESQRAIWPTTADDFRSFSRMTLELLVWEPDNSSHLKGSWMGAYNSPIGCWATRLRQGALAAITAFVLSLGIASGRSQAIATVQSAGTTGPCKASKTMPGGFMGSQSCVPCHQTIYEPFANTSMGRSMKRVT